jgi:hypothetical protein
MRFHLFLKASMWVGWYQTVWSATSDYRLTLPETGMGVGFMGKSVSCVDEGFCQRHLRFYCSYKQNSNDCTIFSMFSDRMPQRTAHCDADWHPRTKIVAANRKYVRFDNEPGAGRCCMWHSIGWHRKYVNNRWSESISCSKPKLQPLLVCRLPTLLFLLHQRYRKLARDRV